MSNSRREYTVSVDPAQPGSAMITDCFKGGDLR